MEETVPTPWTAVSANGNEFNCWGRKAVFGGNGIVSSFLSQGKELLSRPVTLKLNVSAGRLVQEYGIQYWNRRSHTGRQVGLKLIRRDDA